MKKLTRKEFVPGDKVVGNTHYINYHPTGREITCVVTGQWQTGAKVWIEIDENGNEILGKQYTLAGKGKKEQQCFCLVSVN